MSERPWWRGAVIYQVYPRSFLDTNGDGIGDIPGIVTKLDYIADLGVDAIWLSPVFASPMRDFGYDVSDYRAIDPVFGTLDDFDRLVSEAHARGLKLIVDLVFSHTSDQHAWFRESRASRANPRADWYVWADARPDGSPPSNWQSVFHGPAWTWDARRRQYYLHNFLPEQPQLNIHNRAVQDALLDIMRFWLARGVDGFRLDAVNFAMHDPALTDNPPVTVAHAATRPFDFQHHVHNQSHADIPAFLARIRALADEWGTFTLAEVGGENAVAELAVYTRPPAGLHSGYGFDFLYAECLTAARVRAAIAAWPANGGWPSWAFSNHDAPRAISRWGAPEHRAEWAKLALTLLLTLRGDPILWQGEELGLPQAEIPPDRLRDPEAIANWPLTLGRDGARTPMPWCAGVAVGGFTTGDPWLPFDPAHAELAVDSQSADPASTHAFARALIAFRRAHPALIDGAIAMLDVPEPLLAFARGGSTDRCVCVFNLGDRPAAQPLPGPASVLYSTHQHTGGAMPDPLPPRSAWLCRTG